MKIKSCFFILFISILLMSFGLPKNIYKKVAKEIKSVYAVENFTLKAVVVSDELNEILVTKISSDELFEIRTDSTLIGYAYAGKAISKIDAFDYLVLFDTELIIKKSKVLIYREDYGMEIGSKRWLKQFIGKDTTTDLRYGDNIIAISGATISARSMTIAINDLLKSVAILKQKEII